MKTGDLIAKWAGGQTLSPGEADELRRGLNDAQDAAATVKSWSAPGNVLDPNLFQDHVAQPFGLLPHECGSLHGILAGSSEVTTTTWTTVKADKTSGATWGRGMKIDPDNGRIYVTGIPRETVILITGWVVWKGDMNSQRVQIKYLADDGSEVTFTDWIPAGHADSFAQVFTHFRSLPSAQTYYYFQVAQYSGSTQYIIDSNIGVLRIR